MSAGYGAARYLIQVDLLTKAREPGSRRDHYRLADDLWYEAFGHKDTLLRRWEEHRRAMARQPTAAE